MIRIGLYQKFFTWAVLNLVLLSVTLLAGIGIVLLFTPSSLFPPSLFNGRVESTMRMAAQELQYLPITQWPERLERSSRELGIQLSLVTLDALTPTRIGSVPEKMQTAARSMPAAPYALCPEPGQMPAVSVTASVALEAGIIPQQYAVFIYEDDLFWYGRTILVSDDEERVRYAFITASSPSLTGHGQFFNLGWPLALLAAGLGLSFLWWWPFVRHLNVPIIHLTRMTERLAAGDYSPLDATGTLCGSERSDQIGSLARSTRAMGEKVRQQVHGQRRFIRHIAHELDSPLARIKLGLAVLSNRVSDENRGRVDEISEDVEQLSILVEDVLSFMRSEAVPENPVCEPVSVAPLLDYVLRSEARNADVRVRFVSESGFEADFVDPALRVKADASCLGRALANVLRNAVRYAGADGPIKIAVNHTGSMVRFTVCDDGPGVNAYDLEHITEPFYRGVLSSRYPGGSGLGMAIVKHGVNACHGTISYRNARLNEPFRGLYVEIQIPAA